MADTALVAPGAARPLNALLMTIPGILLNQSAVQQPVVYQSGLPDPDGVAETFQQAFDPGHAHAEIVHLIPKRFYPFVEHRHVATHPSNAAGLLPRAARG